MLRKVRFIMMFMSLSVCLCLMSSTYSRYVADTTGNIDLLFAKWQILVNNNDVTNGTASNISFVPTIEENANVAANVIAPSSKGYYDIVIDPSNVNVSFTYNISLGIENENVPDLMITKYAIIPNTYVEGDPLDIVNLSGNTITNTLTFDKVTENFKFASFTIRVYFEWYEGENELMDDAADTVVGNTAATEATTLKMSANVNFQQVF